MLESILPYRSYPFLTSSNRITLILGICALAGCSRGPSASAVYTAGYVRLDDLARLHPGWEDVKRLDELMNRARSLQATPTPMALTTAAAPPLPPPLAGFKDSAQRLAANERRRIEAAEAPAAARVEELQNTINSEMLRRAEREELAIRTRHTARLIGDENALVEKMRSARRAIDREEYPLIRDLKLKEIALDSQVQALYPSEARTKAQDKLSDTRKQIVKLEEQLDSRLKAVDEEHKRKVADLRLARKSEEERELAEFRRTQADEAEKMIAEKKAAIDLVLTTLDPLQPPQVPAMPRIRSGHLKSPAELAAESARPSPSTDTLRIPTALADLDQQRVRIVRFIRADVRRRVERLAAQRRWSVAFDQSTGRDMTRDIAVLLEREWNP